MNFTPARFQRKASTAEAALAAARRTLQADPRIGYRFTLMSDAAVDRLLANVGALVALGAWDEGAAASLAREFTERERAAIFAAVLAHVVPALLQDEATK